MSKLGYFGMSLWVAAGSVLLSSASYAQQAPAYSPTGTTTAESGTPTPAGAIPLGPINAYPSIGLSLKHDDNLFSTPNNTKSDWSKSPIDG